MSITYLSQIKVLSVAVVPASLDYIKCINGVIIDSGWDTTTIIPLYDHRPLYNCHHSLPIGYSTIIDHLRNTLQSLTMNIKPDDEEFTPDLLKYIVDRHGCMYAKRPKTVCSGQDTAALSNPFHSDISMSYHKIPIDSINASCDSISTIEQNAEQPYHYRRRWRTLNLPCWVTKACCEVMWSDAEGWHEYEGIADLLWQTLRKVRLCLPRLASTMLLTSIFTFHIGTKRCAWRNAIFNHFDGRSIEDSGLL